MLPKNIIKYNPKLYARGKRGLVYTFNKNNKILAIKIKNPKSKAEGRIQNEVYFLKILNKYNIGPKLLFHGLDYFCYEFIEGKDIKQYLKQNKKIPKIVLNNIMKQCKIMDKLKINKEEMHRPLKNVIIKNNKPILIDFERCRFTERPKNVNQFKQFLRYLKCRTK